MKIRFLPIAIFALLLISSQLSFSQDDISTPLMPVEVGQPIYIGPVLGYNRALHTVDLASFVDDPLCPFFSNGTANGFYAGVSLEYLLGNVKSSKSSIIFRVLYNTMPAYFEKDGDRYPSLVDDGQGGFVTVNSHTRHSIDVSFSMLTGEIMYKLNLFDSPLGVTAGLALDVPMTQTMEQKYEIIEPLNVQFKRDETAGYIYEDDDRTIIVKRGDIEGASGFRTALKAGLQYEILFGRMYVVPAVYYNYAITKLTDADDWFVHALQMGVDVRFSL